MQTNKPITKKIPKEVLKTPPLQKGMSSKQTTKKPIAKKPVTKKPLPAPAATPYPEEEMPYWTVPPGWGNPDQMSLPKKRKK